MTDRLLIISGDNHAGAKLSQYAPYIEEKYRPALKELENEEAEFFAVTGALSTELVNSSANEPPSTCRAIPPAPVAASTLPPITVPMAPPPPPPAPSFGDFPADRPATPADRPGDEPGGRQEGGQGRTPRAAGSGV